MDTFGKRIRELRRLNNLTQKELGQRFRLSESAVGMYERDQREPSLQLVRELADFFQVSIDYLMARDHFIREGKARYEESRSWTDEEFRLADAFIETVRARRLDLSSGRAEPPKKE